MGPARSVIAQQRRLSINANSLGVKKTAFRIFEHFTDLICSTVAALGSIVAEVAIFWVKVAYDNTVGPLKERRDLTLRIKNATSFQEWQALAFRLDQIEGKDKWRKDEKSAEYDWELIKSRLDQLHRARELNDFAALSFLVRTSMTRNFGGMGNSVLYSTARSGTKCLIEEFTNELTSYMEILSIDIDSKMNPAELKTKIDFFKGLRHALGNTALLLSGGAALGIYHIGVLKALHEADLLPHIIAGSSAGSIVAAVACTRTNEEYDQLLQLKNVNFEFFVNDDGESFLTDIWIKIQRWIRKGTLFEGETLYKCIKENIGDITFLEAYTKTHRVLNITVSSSTVYEMPRLLNYITAPNVMIWSAVVASCAVPGMFDSAQLMAKDRSGNYVPWNSNEDKWIDGSVENDLPMRRLSELFNVNHFIVSQVNPHINPFLADNGLQHSTFFRRFSSKVWFLVHSEWQYRLQQLQILGIMPKFFHVLYNILEQKYTGDITIVPPLALSHVRRMASAIDKSDVLDAIKRAERATWPKISIIRNHCQVELCLDNIMFKLREKLFDINLNRSSAASSLKGSPVQKDLNGFSNANITNVTQYSEEELEIRGETDIMFDPVGSNEGAGFQSMYCLEKTSLSPLQTNLKRHDMAGDLVGSTDTLQSVSRRSSFLSRGSANKSSSNLFAYDGLIGTNNT